MQLSIENARYGVEVRTPILYGRVPGQPVWQGGLWLDLLLPSPAPAEPAPVTQRPVSMAASATFSSSTRSQSGSATSRPSVSQTSSDRLTA
jgi:hypothetical protein